MSVLLVAVGLYLTNDVAIKGQRADRFVRAIEQLGQEGKDKLGIRLGGIYALETLMRDSREDENTIIEVLCAFVRTHAPRPETVPQRVLASPADVRAAVSVLGRRPHPYEAGAELDFSNTLLGLDAMDLSGAVLYATRLDDANLHGALLQGADLSFAILQGADLRSATLDGADLRGAVLGGANLRGAYLNGVDMRDTYLDGADLRCTRMDDSTELPPGVARSDQGALQRPECRE